MNLREDQGRKPLENPADSRANGVSKAAQFSLSAAANRKSVSSTSPPAVLHVEEFKRSGNALFGRRRESARSPFSQTPVTLKWAAIFMRPLRRCTHPHYERRRPRLRSLQGGRGFDELQSLGSVRPWRAAASGWSFISSPFSIGAVTIASFSVFLQIKVMPATIITS